MAKTDQSLRRGLQILRAFNDVEHATLGNLATATGLSEATLLRYLRALEEEGYVTRASGDRIYRQSPSVLELGFAALASMEVPKLVEPYMDALALGLGVTANLGRLDGPDVVMVSRAFAPEEKYQPTPISASIGSRLPAFYTAMGRLLLSQSLPTARELLRNVPLEPLTPHSIREPSRLFRAIEDAAKNGYSLVRDELVVGYSNLAVLIEVGRQPPYALSVTVPSNQFPNARLLREMLPQLRSVSDQIKEERRIAG